MKKINNIIVQSSNSGIARIKLNDPESYNSLSQNILKSLIKIFNNLNHDKKNKSNYY